MSSPVRQILDAHSILWLITLSFSTLLVCHIKADAGPVRSSSEIRLSRGWRVQSSARVREKGEVVSSTSYKTEGWMAADLPATVVAVMLQNGRLPDPYFGMNLRSYPGMGYPIGENFSNLPMPDDSPFNVSWWYRTEFQLPLSLRSQTTRLNFDGINYRANIWLNGRQIASKDQVAGAWRIYEFDISGAVKFRGKNVLAVEVFPPQKDDLAITFVDWNPLPPDREMGIWRDVSITATGPVEIRSPYVLTRLDQPGLDAAHLTVCAGLRNTSGRKIKGTLHGRIGEIEFSRSVEIGPGETRTVRFAPDEFPRLDITGPRLWWPYGLGEQYLYTLDMDFLIRGRISDTRSTKFGLREISSEIDQNGHLQFRVNGRRILIRGAGWSPEILLRSNPERQEAELEYVRDLNLNTVRLEGKLEDGHFLDLCDRMGILVMAGWCCCDQWERWKNWDEEDYTVAARSLEDQIRRLRSHASLLVWLNGSDNPPPARVEKMYLDILKSLDWPNPVVSSATGKPAELTGPSGVKMLGPYEYVPPSYWYTDRSRGGAFGFNTETSPGPSVPPVESLRRMLPADRLWPINEVWNFHAGGGVFKDLTVFTKALNERYGEAGSVEEYAMKAQVAAYESHRAMFEAYGRNRYVSTGVVQWMLNNAWPSMIWHLYDFYLRPGGSYFGSKKGCEPVHVQYSYDDRSVVAVNLLNTPLSRVKVKASVINSDSTEKYMKEAVIELGPDSTIRVFDIPDIQGLTPAYFLRLSIEDASGRTLSVNYYWLSTEPDVLDTGRAEWYYTPIKSYADFRSLRDLPSVRLGVSGSLSLAGDRLAGRVAIENSDSRLAFFVRLKLMRQSDGEEILPVLWEDNYISLMPGEKRELSVSIPAGQLQGESPVIEVGGWNVQTSAFPVEVAKSMKPRSGRKS